jgi:hypothetical protein
MQNNIMQTALNTYTSTLYQYDLGHCPFSEIYLIYGMSQKSHNPNFKGKYFVSGIGKFQFAIPGANTGLMSLQQVSGLTFFIFVALSQLCNKHHAIFNSAACVIVERCSQTQSYEAVRQAYQVHFPGDAVPSKSTIFYLLINSTTLCRASMNMLKWIELCL